MKKNKKRTRKAFLFIKAFIRLIDKKIITPITKFILLISEKLGKRTDRFERWLVKKKYSFIHFSSFSHRFIHYDW